MTQAPRLLDRIQIASPCSADWAAMSGDDRRRFCAQCQLHVYNLSAMTQLEAEALLANAKGRVCTRFFRRGDGTVMTRDCPIGLRQRLKRTWARACALASALLLFAGCRRAEEPGAVRSNPVPAHAPPVEMGDVAVPREIKGEASIAPQLQPVPQQAPPRALMGKVKVPSPSDK